MSNGIIVQVIGAVVDVQFPQDAVPKVYDALKIVSEGQSKGGWYGSAATNRWWCSSLYRDGDLRWSASWCRSGQHR